MANEYNDGNPKRAFGSSAPRTSGPVTVNVALAEFVVQEPLYQQAAADTGFHVTTRDKNGRPLEACCKQGQPLENYAAIKIQNPPAIFDHGIFWRRLTQLQNSAAQLKVSETKPQDSHVSSEPPKAAPFTGGLTPHERFLLKLP